MVTIYELEKILFLAVKDSAAKSITSFIYFARCLLSENGESKLANCRTLPAPMIKNYSIFNDYFELEDSEQKGPSSYRILKLKKGSLETTQVNSALTERLNQFLRILDSLAEVEEFKKMGITSVLILFLMLFRGVNTTKTLYEYLYFNYDSETVYATFQASHISIINKMKERGLIDTQVLGASTNRVNVLTIRPELLRV